MFARDIKITAIFSSENQIPIYMKLTLIRVLFSLFLLFTGSIAQAQSSQRDLGIRFSGLADFDFIFKKQKTSDHFIRYRLMALNLQLEHYDLYDVSNLSAGLAIGVEKRKTIAEKLKWIRGWEPGFALNFNYRRQRESNFDQVFRNLGLSPSIGYVLGFQYDVNEHFYVSLETVPRLTGTLVLGTDENARGYILNTNFSFNDVALCLAYRFVQPDR